MTKFTTQQLKESMIELYSRNDKQSNAAYRMVFTELEKRLSDEDLDKFFDAYGI